MSEEQHILAVGTRVLIEVGWWRGNETEIIEIIPPFVEGDTTRYDVACIPGRWYYPDELSVIVEGK